MSEDIATAIKRMAWEAQARASRIPGASLHTSAELALNDALPGLVKALEEAREALAMMIEPETIQETSSLHAWSRAVAAERTVRAALASIRGDK